MYGVDDLLEAVFPDREERSGSWERNEVPWARRERREVVLYADILGLVRLFWEKMRFVVEYRFQSSPCNLEVVLVVLTCLSR